VIDNGRRGRLEIAGVFEGEAGIQGNSVAFRPNRAGSQPATAKGGILEGRPVFLTCKKDAVGPFWTAQFRVIE
jgi:hypothetical protein